MQEDEKNDLDTQHLHRLLTLGAPVVAATAKEGGVCARCGLIAVAFSDELSVKEYAISGLCQKCQDEIFVEPEDDYLDPAEEEDYSEEPDYDDAAEPPEWNQPERDFDDEPPF